MATTATGEDENAGQYYYYYDPNGEGDGADANNHYVNENGEAYYDGATNPATTDTNGAYDPSTYESVAYDPSLTAASAGAKPGVESEQYYYNTVDPNQSNQTQGYCYQGEDGNYYYYEDPAQELLNELQDNTQVAAPTTQQNLARSYEYDNWEPQSYGWFANIIVDTFFSKPFRLYLTILLYCAAVFVAAMGLNYTFALLFRLFAPPDPTHNKDLQAFGYLSMFFYLSFVIVTVFCAIMDMARNLWWQKRGDTVFWGMRQKYFSKQKPPYLVYLIIILVTVFLPLLWGIIEAGIKKQSLLFVAQRYANVAVLATTFGVLVCYVWFYWKSLVYKRSAIVKRAERDEFLQRNKAYKHHPEKMSKTHWYHAVTVLEEFGVDGKTLRYNVIVFTVGCVPLFALLAAQTLTTMTATPTVVWGAISSICVIVIYTLAWMTLLSRKGQWAVYCTFVMIVILLVLGIVGGAIGGNPQAIGVVVVLFVACQGMITRKHKHSLSKSEISMILKVPINKNAGIIQGADAKDKKKKKGHVDTYLLCCRDTLLNYMCCDVQARCRRRHPDVVKVERQLAIKRIALRTDYKALLVWWIIVMFAVAFSIAMGNGVKYIFIQPIAAASSLPVTGAIEQSELCTLTFNVNGSAALRMYDLALLSALSYTWGTLGDADFASWFAHVPTLIRQYPQRLPPTLNYATDGIDIRFSDYVDLSSGYHFITLNSNNRGLSLFRNLDEWGESIALQVAGAISPLINVWSEQSRAAYVQQGTFFKKWFPNSTALNDVSAYVDGLERGGVAKSSILFVGDQFNGGYAKILASRYNISFVAFNAPGTKYKLPFLTSGTQLTGTRSLWSYIDSVEDTTNTFFMPCNSSISANLCGRISTTLDYLLESCGDAQGRTYTNI